MVVEAFVCVGCGVLDLETGSCGSVLGDLRPRKIAKLKIAKLKIAKLLLGDLRPGVPGGTQDTTVATQILYVHAVRS